MLKIRIEGLPEEVQFFSECIKCKSGFDILSESNNYPNRNSRYVRRYYDVELIHETKGNIIMKNNTTIIAVANQKSGVGKTTTTFNLGAALAIKNEKKVLLVDLDLQADLSEYLGYTGKDNNPTMTQLIMEVTSKATVSADIVKSCLRFNETNKLYYLPADINLANAETYMSTALARESILKRILSNSVTEEFDYVIIDCPSSLGVLLINALTAADGMIIPVQTQKFSMDGLQSLTALHNQIRAALNPNLVMGILPTMADNTDVSKNVLRYLREHYRDRVFDTIIHKSGETEKSSEKEYLDLSEEILQLVHKYKNT